MDLQSTRKSVLESNDIDELYTIELDLTEFTGKIYKRIKLSETEMEQSEAKSELSLANSLLGICRERQAIVKDATGRLNHNFRMAAKKELSKDQYQQLMDIAFLPRPRKIYKNQ